mgnify:CR=1 FL=1
MKILTLYRLPQNGKATFGSLVREDGVPFVLTLERVWKNNERGVSCIPTGEWPMKPGFFNNGGYATWEIICLPRENVLFHIGNIDDDSHGCLLVGEQFEPVLNKKTGLVEDGILASGSAFKQFMAHLKGEQEAKLVIVEC